MAEEFDETGNDIEMGRSSNATTTSLKRRDKDPPRYLSRQGSAADSIWMTLSNSLTGEEYVQRTKSYYEFMAGVSGLLAGFTYITTSEEPSLTGIERTVYGIIGVAGFVAALVATVTSIILWVALTILGPECAVFFGMKFAKYHNIPAGFTIIAFILMATSIMISVQGYYDSVASTVSYILVGSAMFGTLSFYAYVRTSSTNYVKKYWQKHPSKRILDVDGYDHTD